MSAEPVVDPERLAALIDGRLTPDERRVVLEQLAASPEMASLYADAVAAQAATQRQSWWLQHGRGPLALAASVLVVVTGTLWYQAVTRTPSDPILAYAEPLSRGGGLPAGWDERPWSDVRGDVVVSPIGRAARFGALSVDLELAMAARDTSAARLAREIAALMASVPASAPVASLYQELASRTAAGGFDSDLLDRARRGAMPLVDAEVVDLAAWTEAVLIQASRSDSDNISWAGGVRRIERLTQRPDLPANAQNLLVRLGAVLRTPSQPRSEALADLRMLLAALAQ